MVVGMRRRNPPPPLVDRLLPDALWQRIQPLLPPPPDSFRGSCQPL
jgi:hypothetical protein